MLEYKTYVRVLIFIFIFIFGGTFVYAYVYAKKYPISLTDRISLDAKLMFIRDMPNRNEIDTIVLGSSIGLNNVDGTVLEKESKKISHVLNLSAFSMQTLDVLQLIKIFPLFPNLKYVIYSVQSLDFTAYKPYGDLDIDLIKKYIKLGKNNTNLRYTFLAYKNPINTIKRRLIWKDTHLAHNKFSNLDYDHTGSAPLHIYGKDIIKRRWSNSYVKKTTKNSYKALDKMIKQLKKENIKFYLVLQPYRAPLVKKYKNIKTILHNFDKKSKKIVLANKEHFLNIHKKLHLEDKYFADRIHLNDKGNVIVSKEIAAFVDAEK